ncbi:alpha/beta fold hydrolase [Algibacter sp. L4_22]|uniref:alpha/beta fold hydrolase n=1 Tax=Algibacter sp. L4_22 TaxID=2942477 RepID=UPI00201B4F0F|nr:alpha/beta hydrolase [Algibacter sp. L4_22]MCL5127794.1 alpha/beta hydrolase [Algibacter sp. L4_22]
MQKAINNYSKIVLLVVALVMIFSCSKDQNINNLDETIFVRHKDADMPAYIHGNASEKIFLIILHGGPGGNGLGYRANTIKSDIEKECAVVYFDQRGSGMAQGSYSKNGISIDIMAQDVLALVKVIKHKYGSDAKFFLMGHSWGGTLGPATLLKDQSDFLGWIDVDGAHNPKGLYFEYISNFRIVATEQIEADNSVEFWQNALDIANNANQTAYNSDDASKLNSKAHNAETKFENDGLNNESQDDSDKFIFKYNILTMLWTGSNTQSILADQGLWETVDYTNQLQEITIPSLVLWGKNDMVVPIKFAQDAYDNLGSSSKKLVIFENSGHSPMLNEPDLFAEEVIQFINTNK